MTGLSEWPRTRSSNGSSRSVVAAKLNGAGAADNRIDQELSSVSRHCCDGKRKGALRYGIFLGAPPWKRGVSLRRGVIRDARRARLQPVQPAGGLCPSRINLVPNGIFLFDNGVLAVSVQPAFEAASAGAGIESARFQSGADNFPGRPAPEIGPPGAGARLARRGT